MFSLDPLFSIFPIIWDGNRTSTAKRLNEGKFTLNRSSSFTKWTCYLAAIIGEVWLHQQRNSHVILKESLSQSQGTLQKYVRIQRVRFIILEFLPIRWIAFNIADLCWKFTRIDTNSYTFAFLQILAFFHKHLQEHPTNWKQGLG